MAAHPNSEEFIIGPPTTSGALKILSDEGFQQTDSNKNNSERYFVSQIEDQSLHQCISHKRVYAESEGAGVRGTWSMVRHSSHTRSKSVDPAG